MNNEPRCEFCPGTETLHIATCPLLQLLRDITPDESDDPEVIALREIFPEVPIIRIPHDPNLNRRD
jgi:hypothetical protein